MFSFFVKTAEAAVVSNLPSIPLLDKINKMFINPFIKLMLGVSLLVFFWGVFQMMVKNANNAKGKEEGRQHMIWGIVGLTIILGVFGILNIVSKTLSSFFQ
jgi:hypothetical protein